MAETLAELEKQREDIKILLSTLEEAFNEASITEEHYKEVKSKNQKKLEEISSKIEELEKEATKEAVSQAKEKANEEKKEAEEKAKKKAEERAAQAKKKTGKRIEEKKRGKARPSAPVSTPEPAAPPASAPPQPGAPAGSPGPEKVQEGESSTEYAGVPQALTDVAGEGEAEEARPEKAPGAVRRGEPGSLQYTSDEIKEMFSKLLKEIKPQGIEVAPRVDKLEAQLEKVRAYIDTIKDERSTGKEGMQRLTEEVGEIRSNVSALDRKVSESEIKVTEISESLGDLRPHRFLRVMKEQDSSIKMHDARIDKLDDLTSVMLKKVGQIEQVLKRLGSLEKIVNFSKEAAKRLLEIENREKRISRIADKIDGIFMELNKRLDEFVLYKAKQDTLDELSQEMMKSLDDLNTKLQKYAEKDDLDSLRDTITSELASIRSGSGASPQVQRLESQKTEVESLIAMLDEQFKSGALPEKDYKKTRQINTDRLKDIENRLAQAMSGSGASPAQSPGGQAEGPGPSAGKPPEEPAQGENPPGKGTRESENTELLSQLEDSLTRGLISREAFDKTKKLIPKEGKK